MVSIDTNVYAIPSGDVDANGQIQNSDGTKLILELGTAGYTNSDTDMNGQVQNADISDIVNLNLGKGEQF